MTQREILHETIKAERSHLFARTNYTTAEEFSLARNVQLSAHNYRALNTLPNFSMIHMPDGTRSIVFYT